MDNRLQRGENSEDEDIVEVISPPSGPGGVATAVSQNSGAKVSGTKFPATPASAGKKRKVDEGWIVNKKADTSDQEDDEMPVGKRKRKTAAVIVDSDSEEEKKSRVENR